MKEKNLHLLAYQLFRMFLKKNELSEEELKQKRMDIDASLQKADERRKEILEQRNLKLKKHFKKVSEVKKQARKESLYVPMTNFEIKRNYEFLTQIDRSNTLESFQMFMQKPDALAGASKLVEFLEQNCVSENCGTVKNRPKVFMSLALLAHYPNEVMPNANQEENELLLKSKEFYENLIDFFSGKTDRTAENQTKLSWCWIRTIHAFDEWLVKDKQALFDKMKIDFLTWTKTVGNLSVNDPSRSDWELHAVNYQNEILNRIHEVFGTGHIEILLNEVQQMNDAFEYTKFIIDFDQEKGKYECNWQILEPDEQEKKIPENTQSEINEIEKLKITNIQILHELMLKENDIDFEGILRFSGKSMKEVSETNKKNLSHLISALKNEADAEVVAIALQELFLVICSSLVELAGENEDYCQEIELTDCSIDPTNWIHDSCGLLRWVLSMCKRCCAPVRDQTCHELQMCIDSIEEDENFINSFANTFSVLLDLLNVMRSDFCNFRLRFLAAQIEGKGIVEQYELDSLKTKFSSVFETTEKWLRTETKISGNPLEHLAGSYIKLFDPCQDKITEATAPETFYLDVDRINRYRSELKLMLMREAALIYTKNHLKTAKCDEINIEKYLNELTIKTNLGENIDDASDAFLGFAEKLVDSDNSLFKGNITRLFNNPLEDKVFLLLKNREISKIRTILMNEQKVTQPQEVVIRKICSLFKYNKSCFSSIYDEIILKTQ